jgi:hypothetical protein
MVCVGNAVSASTQGCDDLTKMLAIGTQATNLSNVRLASTTFGVSNCEVKVSFAP